MRSMHLHAPNGSSGLASSRNPARERSRGTAVQVELRELTEQNKMTGTQSKAERASHEWTATEIVEAVTAGKATCEAVARACLERIALREPDVQAWTYLDPEQVIGYARAL